MELLTSTDKRQVWIPNHPAAGYLPGRVEETGEDGILRVVDETGESFKIPSAEAQSVDPACLTGVDDLLSLGDFNEAALLHNIRVRYGQDKIYTGIGSPILISVNPYRALPGLYTAETQKRYRGAARTAGLPGGPPVHLYAVADAAYCTMLYEQLNQSIIITGESGAGKTEATKRILAYLAEMQRSTFRSSSSSAGGGECAGDSSNRTVEKQVLAANPVLEAFGNAKTVRNDNSSRFGKFVEVEFDASGKLLSAHISNYLLEKCRIVTQQPDERNYHIFYQLCASGAAPGLPAGLPAQAAAELEYVRTCESIPGVDDAADFAEVLECMLALGFTSAERDSALRVVAAVLQLGNLTFAACARDGHDGVSIGDVPRVALICELLGVEVQQLHNVLEQKTLEDPLTKKIIHMPHNVQSASYTRHSLAKVVYARLFDWLVCRINDSISGHGKPRQDLRRIGLLDIYGFEVFDWNSFEQLCINFANEKLQQHFNAHMFTQEQQMYTNEGISWSHISWQDNQHIIDALEKRPLGLFCLVDSECIMPSATDDSLLGKIYSTFKSSRVIYKPGKFASTEFAVAHYAGEVLYSVDTFLEKNTDKMHADVVNLLKSSQDELVRRLFTDPRLAAEPAQKQPGKDARAERKRRISLTEGEQRRERQNVTVGMMFREQLDKLVEDLNKTNPRYVRCIKPNGDKQPQKFDSVDVLRQLRCAGMLESIRIRRAGYAVRRLFKDFFTRFRILAPSLAAAGPEPDYRELCRSLASEVEQRLAKAGVSLEEKSWQIGQSKIFMKEDLERHFERLIVESAKHHVATLQRRWRGFVELRAYRRLRAGVADLQAALRARQAADAYEEARAKAAAEAAAREEARLAALAFEEARAAAAAYEAEAKRQAELAAASAPPSTPAGDDASADAPPTVAAPAAGDVPAVAAAAAKTGEAAAPDAAPPRAEPDEALLEENRRLQQRLKDVEAAMADSLATVAAVTSSVDLCRTQELAEEVARLRDANQKLQTDLRLATTEEATAAKRAEEMDRQVREMRLEHSRAAGNLNDTASLAALRSEILARCGLGGDTVPTLGAQGHPLNSALRRLEGVAAAPSPVVAEGGRQTLVNQRELFERLKVQFALAQDKFDAEDDIVPLIGIDEPRDDVRSLEDEVRRLRRENAAMRTREITAQEEAIERAAEVESILRQSSRLQAELDDLRLQQRGDTSGLRQQLHETLETLRQQNEDMARLVARAEEAEQRAAASSAEAQAAEEELVPLRERAAELDRGRAELERQLNALREAHTDIASRGNVAAGELELLRAQALADQQEWRQEREGLVSELRARENEVGNIKRVLDDVMGAHVPVEEVQRWKARAASLEQQYQQAMRYNREMASAVGHMTQAASERGDDLNELRLRNAALTQEVERWQHELKMAELEKQDLQKALDTLQSSCNYFQTKYKATQNELRNSQREHASAADSLAHTRAQLEALRAHMAASAARAPAGVAAAPQ